jgi:hypothetical protein
MLPHSLLFTEMERAKRSISEICNPKPQPEIDHLIPMRSPKTSISLSYATWNRYSPSILLTFRRIKEIALKANSTEYKWIGYLVNELETEINAVKDMLEECSLGSPEE